MGKQACCMSISISHTHGEDVDSEVHDNPIRVVSPTWNIISIAKSSNTITFNKHSAKSFIYIISLNFHHNPIRLSLFLSLFFIKKEDGACDVNT